MRKIQSSGTRSRCSWIIIFSALALFLMVAPAFFVKRRAPQVSAHWISGYYESSSYSPPVANIPWSDYTHMLVQFYSANSDCAIYINAMDSSNLSKLVSKAHAHNVKVLYSMIDQTGSSGPNFPTCTASANLNTFVDNMIAYMNSLGFDGIDLDWESNIIVSQYVSWISALRAALPAGKLLTAAMGSYNSMPTVAAAAYGNFDQINIMCYDQDWNGSFTWFNAPLYRTNFTGDGGGCDGNMNAFTSAGVPAAKLGVGMPFYGRRWTGVTQPLQTGGTKIGSIRYGDLVNDPVRWQNAYKNLNTTYYGQYLSIPSLNEFISYTDQTSIQEAVTWGKSQGYGGFMAYSITQEYLSGQSTVAASFPLSTALWKDVTGEVGPTR